MPLNRERALSHLKHHVYGWRELDALAVGQTQHLVVVQHRVHVLNPQRVDRPVADHPLVVLGGVADGVAHAQRHQAVAPLQRQAVFLNQRSGEVLNMKRMVVSVCVCVCVVCGSSQHLSVELSHCDRLGVEDVGLDELVEGVVFAVAGAIEGLQRVGQDDVHGGLAAAGGADQHDAVAHQHGLVQLDHLRNTAKLEVSKG